MTRFLFKNRAEAGKLLAQKVSKYKLEKPFVLALTNGGVVIGAEVARALNCPLKPIVAKKIFYPFEDSLGFGAVDNRGKVYLSQYAEGVPPEVIQEQIKPAQEIVENRKQTFQKFLSTRNLSPHTTLLVDDSLATGSTMMAALASIKPQRPKKVIIAATITSQQAVDLLSKKVNQFVSLYRHPAASHTRLSDVYEDYSPVSDQKVLEILRQFQNPLS